MKKLDVSKLTRRINKVGFVVKKHSPEILVVAGIAGTVASTIMACKATTKVSTIMNESKEQINQIHDCMGNEDLKASGKYTEEDGKKDLVIVYTQTGVKLVKLYGPAVALGILSVGCILTSHRILSKRNIALAAAYATVDKGFKEYRSRVVDRFGETIDRELKYNIKAKEVEIVETDENGNEKTVTKAVNVVDPSDVSEYARFFEEYTKDEKGNVIKNTYWQPDNEYNLVFLKQTERYANERLRSKGILFLNEVYEMLNLPKSKAGQIVGWVYNEKEPVGDNFVDFGLYRDNLSYSDFVNGYEPAILLDFNVDGNVWEMM